MNKDELQEAIEEITRFFIGYNGGHGPVYLAWLTVRLALKELATTPQE